MVLSEGLSEGVHVFEGGGGGAHDELVERFGLSDLLECVGEGVGDDPKTGEEDKADGLPLAQKFALSLAFPFAFENTFENAFPFALKEAAGLCEYFGISELPALCDVLTLSEQLRSEQGGL